MIAEILPGMYDYPGKKTLKPNPKRIHLFHPTYPMGRYVSQPLSEEFKDIDELRQFLRQCRYVTDIEQFNKRDHWVPPEEFEQTKQGDCEDFSLYVWRQLTAMGIPARFVVGISGKQNRGHAWVTMEKDGTPFLFEPLACSLVKLPRLNVLRYQPETSVEFSEGKLSYYSHKALDFKPSMSQVISLYREWFVYYAMLKLNTLTKLISSSLKKTFKRPSVS